MMPAQTKCMQAVLVTLLLPFVIPAVKISTFRRVAYLLTEAETGHPIAQVVSTIEATAAQANAEGNKEEAAMEKATAHNAKAEQQLAGTIQESQGKIENAEAKATAGKAQQEALADDVEAGSAQVAKLQAAGKAAAADRAEVVKVEQKQASDAAATVGAIKDALGQLDKAAGSNEDKAKTGSKVNGGKVNGGLLEIRQVQAVSKELMLMPSVMRALSDDEEGELLKFASDAQTATKSPLTGAAPTAKPYVSKLGKVMDLFKRLMHKIGDDQHKADMAAMQAKTEYELAKGARDEALKVAQEALVQKKKMLLEVEASNAQVENDIKKLNANLAADRKSLKDRQTTFELKTQEFKERTYMRKRELKAMAFGMEILAQVAGVRKPASSMLQLDHTGHSVKGYQKKVDAVKMLREKAARLDSSDLQRLADRLETHLMDNGIGKQVDLTLMNRVWTLTDEQLADDKKKLWCDMEINKTTIKRGFKSDDLKELGDRSTSLTADVDDLLDDIKAAKTEVEEKKKQIHEDTLDRMEAKDEAKDTIKDARKAQDALRKGIDVIQQFYKDARDRAEAAALIQTHFSLDLHDDADPGFDGAFTGTNADGKGPGGKIIEVLEQTQADFAQMEAETKAQEAQDETKFEDAMKDYEAAVATKTSELELKTEEKTRLLETLRQTKDSRALSDRQKAALEVYLKDLNMECDYALYQARKANRSREILSLNASRVVLSDAFNTSNVSVNATSFVEETVLSSAALASATEAAVTKLPAVPKSKPLVSLVPGVGSEDGGAGAEWVLPKATPPERAGSRGFLSPVQADTSKKKNL